MKRNERLRCGSIIAAMSIMRLNKEIRQRVEDELVHTDCRWCEKRKTCRKRQAIIVELVRDCLDAYVEMN